MRSAFRFRAVCFCARAWAGFCRRRLRSSFWNHCAAWSSFCRACWKWLSLMDWWLSAKLFERVLQISFHQLQFLGLAVGKFGVPVEVRTMRRLRRKWLFDAHFPPGPPRPPRSGTCFRRRRDWPGWRRRAAAWPPIRRTAPSCGLRTARRPPGRRSPRF